MVEHFYVGKVPDAEIAKIPSDAFDLHDKTKCGIVNFTGLDRPDADISRSALAGANASRIGGSQISERNIVLTVRPWIAAEINRQELYDNLPFDTDLRFYIVTENRCVFIDGRVEKLGGGRFTQDVTDIQLSIVCPFPWFQSVELHTQSLVVGNNNPILYDGDVPAGWTLNVPPQESPPLAGSVGDLEITISGETFAYSGNISVPTICAIPGRKSFTGIRSATGDTRHPAFNAMIAGCQWPMISRNGNNVSVSCSNATREFFEKQNVFTYRDTYSGV